MDVNPNVDSVGESLSLLLGFQGSQCEIDVDACEMFGNDTVCLNGATCLDSEVELEFSCLCVAGFTGECFLSASFTVRFCYCFINTKT